MATKAQLEGNARYLAKLEDIKVRVPKDGTKARYKAHAESLGMSLNSYIVALIEKDMAEQILPPKD